MTVFFLFALLLTLLLIAFGKPLLRLLDTPEDSFALTYRYVAVCAAGNVFICGYNAISAILRGYGDSLRPMIFVGIACVINIVLDVVFVKEWGMGVEGTAFATIISQGISMILAVAYLKWKSSSLILSQKAFARWGRWQRSWRPWGSPYLSRS